MTATTGQSPRGQGSSWFAWASVLAALALVGSAALYLWIGDDHSDIGVYHHYALTFFEPSGPARHLPLEYPPLALVPFSLTLLPLGIDYGALFVLAMAALFIAAWIAVARTVPRSTAIAFAVYLLLAGPWTLLGRYDLVPALVVLAAVTAAGRRRWSAAYALLAIGVLLKLFPLFLFPLFALEQRREARSQTIGLRRLAVVARGPVIFVVIVLAGACAAALVEPGGWLTPFRYAFGRPVESESVAATVLWILSGFGSPGTIERSFNSVNVVAPVSGAVGAACLLALVCGCLLVYALHARGRLTLRRASLTCLAVVVVTSKVLSPQYLVWLLPLVAFEVGLEPVWVGVCVLTLIAYPIVFELAGLIDAHRAADFPFAFLAAVAARNALLIVATVHVIRARSRAPTVAVA